MWYCAHSTAQEFPLEMPARTFTVLLVSLFLLGGIISLHGQEQAPAAQAPAADAPAPISTDRPAITNSSIVVPVGSVQVENGFLETGGQGQSVVDGPESLVRIGVAKKTELRFNLPDYFHNLTIGGAASGLGDFAVGVKQQLGPTPEGFDVSAIVFVSFPTGASGVTSGGYDPGLQVPWSRALSANWTAAGMFSVYWPTQGRTRNVTGETAFLFDRQLTKPWDAFVEYAGDFPENGGPRHLLHFGTALKIAKEQQIDFHVGVGLSRAAVDHIIGVGYSFRIQAFRR
jgi:hypothetical protein